MTSCREKLVLSQQMIAITYCCNLIENINVDKNLGFYDYLLPEEYDF
jgi:hypothetical protein